MDDYLYYFGLIYAVLILLRGFTYLVISIEFLVKGEEDQSCPHVFDDDTGTNVALLIVSIMGMFAGAFLISGMCRSSTKLLWIGATLIYVYNALDLGYFLGALQFDTCLFVLLSAVLAQILYLISLVGFVILSYIYYEQRNVT